MNLDDIEIRVGRGQYSEQDVQALLAAAKNPDSDVVDRIGKGYRNMIDVAYLFALVAQQSFRPSAAERAAKDAAATAKALADAQAKRDAENAKALAALAAEAEQRNALVTSVQETQNAQVQAIAINQQFSINQAKALQQLEEKRKVATDLLNQLGS